MAANGASVHLERAQHADETGLDLLFVQLEDADVGQLGSFQPGVQVAGDPFHVGPESPEAVDPGRVEVDADEAPGDNTPSRSSRSRVSKPVSPIKTEGVANLSGSPGPEGDHLP